MTLCPIALAIGCKKCPVFKICPVKNLIGDMPKAAEEKPVTVKKPAAAKKTAPARKTTKK